MGGEKSDRCKRTSVGGMIWALLPVAIWRIHRLCWPWPLSTTLTTYLPSDEMVASSTLPEFVSFAMLMFWNGTGPESPRHCINRVYPP